MWTDIRSQPSGGTLETALGIMFGPEAREDDGARVFWRCVPSPRAGPAIALCQQGGHRAARVHGQIEKRRAAWKDPASQTHYAATTRSRTHDDE